MGTFDEFAEALVDGSKALAKDIFDGFEVEAMADARAFLEQSRNDLQSWTRMLAQGEISEQDFSDFVQARKALAVIHALRQKGVALTKLERFRSEFINLVIDTAFDVFL